MLDADFLSEPTVSRILFFFSVTLEEATIIYLAERLLARSSDLPGSFRRATLERSPIWSCSVWGLPCLRCHHRSGALLPHLFTLTASPTEAEPRLKKRRCIFCGTFLPVTRTGR